MTLRIRFGVSSRRNWSALWKPAIDALGSVLGVQDLTKPSHPDDDRIVDLALHRTIDDALGNDVDIEAWWSQAVAPEHRSAVGISLYVRTIRGIMPVIIDQITTPSAGIMPDMQGDRGTELPDQGASRSPPYQP